MKKRISSGREVAKNIPKVLLWLFVINLGIVLGAGLYEARIEFPQWLVYSAESGYRWDAEAARHANTGLRFWVYVTTVPLTLLTLANLIAAWRAKGRHTSLVARCCCGGPGG
jgi:hypothetical protein